MRRGEKLARIVYEELPGFNAMVQELSIPAVWLDEDD